MDAYDLEDVYDTQIAPLMTKIIEICQANGIPMFASFAYLRDTAGGYDCCTTAIPRFDGEAPDTFKTALAILYQKGSEV